MASNGRGDSASNKVKWVREEGSSSQADVCRALIDLLQQVIKTAPYQDKCRQRYKQRYMVLGPGEL